ncbi:DGQHR domain-containing protein [Planococcus plakortidis]|uniref:DGQHR domain-containing protein n=1 Tax=Planococcus plakortidis TaxID=1038856 RepID=UPI00385957DA
MNNYKYKIPIIEVSQPIGTFYISALDATILEKISKVSTRLGNKGYQREETTKRVNDIKKFSEDEEAIFPTPIVLSIDNSLEYTINENQFCFNDSFPFAEIIDGQHRAAGIFKSSQKELFQLPVILLFDLTEEEKAYIFSTINSKQTKVSMSLIYDLFSISQNRSPQKTCHEVARLLNTDEASPFYNRLKMLGKKESDFSSLSQGSFIRYLLPLISRNPDEDLLILKNNPNAKLKDDIRCPLRYYFINEQDEMIYKIISNVFKAIRDTFPMEWENHNKFILSKTTGYGAIMRAFPSLFELGASKGTLTYEFFLDCFYNFALKLKEQQKILTSEYFPSNENEQKKLANLILSSNHLLV